MSENVSAVMEAEKPEPIRGPGSCDDDDNNKSDVNLHEKQPIAASADNTQEQTELHQALTHSPTENDDGDDGGQAHLQPTTTSTYIAATLSLPHEILFVAVICCAQLTTQAGLAQTLSIISIIGDHFGLSKPGDLSWFVAAYGLTVGTFILVSGRLGDLFGHKRMLVIGYLWFALWTAVAGLAVFSESSSVIMFDVARALQGIGPSILIPNALAILGSSYPPGPRKNMVFAIFGAMAPGGGVLGSTFAALFALAWWPWAFWSLSITLVLLAGLSIVVVPSPSPSPVGHGQPSQDHAAGFWAKLKRVDLAGAAVGVTALVLINIAWNQAPIVGWRTPYTYVLLIIGLLLLPVFFYIELNLTPYPLIPLKSLKNPSSIAFVLGCLACGWGTFGIWLLYLWQFHLQLREASPLLASAYISPVAITGALAAIATGYLLGRMGPAWTMVVAMSAFVTGISLVATMPIDQTYWGQAFVCVLVTVWGMDMSFPASTVILSNAVGKGDQGVAASLVNTIVNYSISLALGFAGTAEANVNKGGTTKEDVLRGLRAALYVGVGLAGFGWVLSLVFLWFDYRGRSQSKKEDGENGELSSSS
ncbi:major facilitator superfamily-domain-containing protein [Apodospora peruviana]|uniref:Major facilitator superfamily-domain-containing protein n=1 Tax=Apodospora peruviana TaxID=516989 RepID=A0AAE0M229_9PEZI|nr:major facilitator superfamily-domain-containing protein [Apodospora peruviana]